METARRLMAAEPQVGNALNDEGLPVVLVALYNGHRAVAEALVDGGATLHIFEAAALGHLERVQAVAEKWPGWINEFSKDGFTPLQLACFFGQEATALWLIEQGAKVNTVARHPFGLSAIHAASANGNLTVLRTLLEQGAAVNARQAGGRHRAPQCRGQRQPGNGPPPPCPRGRPQRRPRQRADAAGPGRGAGSRGSSLHGCASAARDE